MPDSFSFGELDPDWERISPYLEQAMGRVPASLEVGAKKLFCGPESFTPDLAPIIGEAPELRHYYIAAGLNSIGILTGPGVGRVLAHQIVHGHADVDVTAIAPARLQPFQATTTALSPTRTPNPLAHPRSRPHPCSQLHPRSRPPSLSYSASPPRSLSPSLLPSHSPSSSPSPSPLQATPAYRKARVVESLGKVYKCHYPHRPTLTARGVRRSPLHERLAARGAYFRDVSGWEGADWFAGAGQTAELGELSWGRHAGWWGRWAAEHVACRDACVLLDMSFMSKFLVRGRDAGALLDWLATSHVDLDGEGTITYTQLLSPRGTLEADLTITKLPADCAGVGGLGGEPGFLVVATDTAHRHVESLLRRGAEEWGGPHGARVSVTDVTGGLAQINLQGPSSRALLSRLTGAAAVSDGAFPFRGARTIAIGCAPVLATRITYVGELGYELFVPTEAALHVYDLITAEGEGVGLTHAGLKALGSLRMEKGYRDYGHDLDNCDTLLEAGLGFTADYDKPGGFVGMEACLAQRREGGPVQRLVQICLAAPEPLLFHGEVVYRNGEIVGDVRAASYGHTLGGAVGLSMVRAADGEKVGPAWISGGDWEVDVAGVRVPARASLRPMYDPTNERIRL